MTYAMIQAETASAGPPRRMDWLDALRGFAALIVVWFHLSPYLLGEAIHNRVLDFVDLGKYGVLLFFMVSGYVIPMSLERRGSLRHFWVGRIFRIYPAFLAATLLMITLITIGILDFTDQLVAEPVTGALGHLTMMQDILGIRGIVRVFWTLSYEMIFYLIVAGLFAWNLQRHSALWASGLALTALIVGPRLPDGLLTPDPSSRFIVAAALVLIVAISLIAYVVGRRAGVLAAGAFGIAFILLPALNGSPTEFSTAFASWDSLSFLAVMFSGTVIYRAHHGQVRQHHASMSLLVVFLGVVGAHWLHAPGEGANISDVVSQHLSWTITVTAVAATFAFVFYFRSWQTPRLLVRIGALSYSIYLLHPIVLALFRHWLPTASDLPPVAVPLVGFGYAVVVTIVSLTSYHMIERPAQGWHKRIGRALDSRFDPVSADRVPRSRRRETADEQPLAASSPSDSRHPGSE